MAQQVAGDKYKNNNDCFNNSTQNTYTDLFV